MNEYLAVDGGGDVRVVNSLRAVIAAWPNASKSRVCVGNRFAHREV